MSWQILAIISVLSLSVAVLLQRILLKNDKSDPIAYAIVFQFGLGLISFVLAIIFKRFALPNDFSLLPFFVISALLWSVTTIFGFKAMKLLSAGEVTILGASNSLVTVVLSLLFLQEAFKLSIIFGTACILVAVWIVQTEKISVHSRSGIVFALLSALSAGIALISDALILRSYDAFSYMAVMSFLPGLIISVLFPRRIRIIKNLLNNKIFKIMGVLCFLYSIQAICYYLAFQNGAPMAQLAPFGKSYVVLTVLLAAVFLKERTYLKKKIFAAILITLGAILLS